jgi:hypothetical protein
MRWTGRFLLPTLAALVAAPALALGAAPASGVRGVVKKGPIMPVCRVGVPCDAPVKVTLLFSRGGRVVAQTRSDAKGRYRIALSPGSYDVRTKERIGIRQLPSPHTVHVRAGHWDRIDFFIDTGIR